MKKYTGYELSDNYEVIGKSQFVVFGRMAEGVTCYHKIVDGVEDESCWYSCFKFENKKMFIVEGE